MSVLVLDTGEDWPEELARLERFLGGYDLRDTKQIQHEGRMSVEEKVREQAKRAQWRRHWLRDR